MAASPTAADAAGLTSSLLRRVPVWVWLAAIVVASAVVRALLAGQLVAPFIMVDELIWSEIARGIAEVGHPLLRDQPDPGYSPVYPLLISPAYAMFDRLPQAYGAVKTWNAVMMSLAAVPAFYLARRLVSDRLALLAAALAVAIPSLAYTGTVMTENAFYPLFLVVALVLVLVLEEPSFVRTVILLALLAVAFETRVQAVALLPAVLLAPLVLAVFERGSFPVTVRRFRWLYGLLGGAIVVLLVAVVVTGRSPNDLLGSYSPVGERSYGVGDSLRYLWWHVAELSLYTLAVPLAATVVLVGMARGLDARLQAFLAAAVSLTVCVVPVVAVFASEFSDRIEERNLFYVVPLLCVALLAWVDRGAPRPRALAIAAAVVSAVLVAAVPLERFLTTSAITDTLMLLPLWSLSDHVGEGWTQLVVDFAAALLAAAFLLVPRRYAVVLPFLVLGVWILAIRPIWWGTHGLERFSRGALFQGIRTTDRDWIDRALPGSATAGILWTGVADRLTVNENEFFNRRLGPVYYLTRPTPGGLPETRVAVDPETGNVTLPDGNPVRVRYLVADSSFEPDGKRVATDEGWGMTLWRVRPPLVSAVRVDGLYPGDTWSGRQVTYARRRCVQGTLTVRLSSDASLFLRPQTVIVRSGDRVVARRRLSPYRRLRLTVPVSPAPGGGQCRVVYTITPTAVPAVVTGGANPDPRVLGAHFERFLYRPRS